MTCPIGTRSAIHGVLVLCGAALAVGPSTAPATDASGWIPVAATAQGPRIDALAVHADRGLVLMDTYRAGSARHAVATFRRSGTGAVRTGVGDLGLGPSVVLDAVADGRGGWIVLTHPTDGTAASRVTRLGATGRVDRTFGTDGSTVFNAQSSGLTVDPWGRIWVVGTVYRSSMQSELIAVTRIRRGGELDTSYGPRGTREIALPRDRVAARLGVAEQDISYGPSRIAAAPTGHVVIAGSTSASGVVGATGFLTRLTRTGEADPTFGTQGIESYGPIRPSSISSNGIYGQALDVEPLFGNIYVAGVPARDPKTVVWKRTARGSRYGSFVNHGWLRLHNLTQTELVGATCHGGLWIADRSVIQIRTRAGRLDRRFNRTGVLRLRDAAGLLTVRAAAYDRRSCRLTGARIERYGSVTGVRVQSFGTPRR